MMRQEARGWNKNGKKRGEERVGESREERVREKKKGREGVR